MDAGAVREPPGAQFFLYLKRRKLWILNLKRNFQYCGTGIFQEQTYRLLFFYTKDKNKGTPVKEAKGHVCFIGTLRKVFKGETLSFKTDSIGCFGGKRYSGFTSKIIPNFEYFLSCGIEGKMEGERYKKTPQLVKEIFPHFPFYEAPETYLVFTRWDKLAEEDNPDAVIFFAAPDILSGLFTLASFDEKDSGVITPFSSGCGSVITYPYTENKKENPKAVLGMFDVSARPFVPEGTLSFAVPMKKFTKMVDNMEESFLITGSWKKIRKRFKSH